MRAALEPRDVAIVIAEPTMTNNVGLLLPESGFHDALRAITRETGTVLLYDETHTQVVGPGGLTKMWSLEPDMVTIGKSIASGVPLGAYGMIESVAVTMQRPEGRFDEKEAIATGGTLFGNPLSMAAARATMGSVLTGDVYAHTHALGARLADGIEKAIGDVGTAVDHAPVLAALRRHVRARHASQRARGVRSEGHPAHAALAGLPGEPRRVGRHRGSRPDVRGTRDRGGRRSLPRGVRLIDRGADGLGPAGRDALAFRDGG